MQPAQPSRHTSGLPFNYSARLDPEAGCYVATVEMPTLCLWVCELRVYATSEEDLERRLGHLVNHYARRLAPASGARLN